MQSLYTIDSPTSTAVLQYDTSNSRMFVTLCTPDTTYKVLVPKEYSTPENDVDSLVIIGDTINTLLSKH